MKKQRSTKRALLLSALSLLMCVSMLIGSTFAWFTDSVTSAGNKIQAGNLAVDLKLYKGGDDWESIKTSGNPIFNYSNWEPGYIDAKLLEIVNEGSLALKWKAKITTQASLGILADVIDVYVKPGITKDQFNSLGRNDLSTWTNAGTVREFVEGIETSTYGTLNPKSAAGDSATLGIALKMREEAGNEYKNQSIEPLDIMILATQYTSESDSFDDQYDKDSEYPLVTAGTKAGNPINLAVKHESGFEANVQVPANAEDGNYALVIPPESIAIDAAAGSIGFDMYLELDGERVTPVPGVAYTATITLPHPYLEVIDVLHNGGSVGQENFDQISATEVKFSTTNFSPFEIVGKIIDEVEGLKWADTECKKIAAGIFRGINPADYDKTLLDKDNAYMVIDFVKDGETYYAVSERATTVIIAAASADSFLEGRDASYYEGLVQTNQSGNLHNIVTNMKANGQTTLYITPGTYNQASTVYIRSNMDIIGLGDADDIKLIKGSASNSNRHLLNVTGSENTEYIDVTIRNLYLNATQNTTGGKDNAAVQAYDIVRVKCYDLIIEKEKDPAGKYDFMNSAFYVNANGKTGAFMYVENTVISSAYVLDTNSPYKFYYYNLATSNGTGTYTTNNSNVKNQQMDAEDWIWD